MADSADASVTHPPPAPISKVRFLVIKGIALTVLTLALGFTQGWMAKRYYQPGYVAGFHTGVIEGALMPAALPGLLLGQDVPIYAADNAGRPYKIGYILGLNTCGTFFFGLAFWQPRRRG